MIGAIAVRRAAIVINCPGHLMRQIPAAPEVSFAVACITEERLASFARIGSRRLGHPAP
jgi:hypothetical protein